MKTLILLSVKILLVILIVSCTRTDESPDVIVDIKVSKDGYSPSEIYLEKGQVVLFRIKALDEGIGADYSKKYYGHCFYILPPYDIMVENIKEGEIKEIKVKMIYPGKFIFTCPYCSGLFPTKGEIIVK
ncbi:cupredoxin domain-containing protein [Persephonella sp.]